MKFTRTLALLLLTASAAYAGDFSPETVCTFKAVVAFCAHAEAVATIAEHRNLFLVAPSTLPAADRHRLNQGVNCILFPTGSCILETQWGGVSVLTTHSCHTPGDYNATVGEYLLDALSSRGIDLQFTGREGTGPHAGAIYKVLRVNGVQLPQPQALPEGQSRDGDESEAAWAALVTQHKS